MTIRTTGVTRSRLELERRIALGAVAEAARVAMAVRADFDPQDAAAKADRSPVTVADLAAQTLISLALAEQLPADGVMGEEDSAPLVESPELAAAVLAAGVGVGAWQVRQAAHRRAEAADRARDELERLARNADALVELAGQCEAALRENDADRATAALGQIDRRLPEGGGEAMADRANRCRADLAVLRELDAVDTFRWTAVENKLPDQAAVADLEADAAVAALLRRLAPAAAGRALDAAEQAMLEDAIEQMAPEVALEALAACPECGASTAVAIDPYLTLQLAGGEIHDEVHVLARSYHWAEADILALPRERRKRYLRLIDRERGMVSHDAT